MKDKDAPYFMVQSLDRALSILDLFIKEQKPLGVTEISNRLDLHKSSVHRLLATLQTRGYVERDKTGEKYWVGQTTFELGALYINTTSLVDESKPFMQQLVDELGLRAHLAVIYDGMVIYLKHVEPSISVRLDNLLGERTYVHCSALGKCLVAWKSEGLIIKILNTHEMRPRTPNTIRTPAAFLHELEKVRQQGYALDDQEAELGVRCIAAPIWNYTGEVVAAISINGLAETIVLDKLDEWAATVKRYANAISVRLGGR
jgi:IclR family transcriptional regulator, KDG regulon repressor